MLMARNMSNVESKIRIVVTADKSCIHNKSCKIIVKGEDDREETAENIVIRR